MMRLPRRFALLMLLGLAAAAAAQGVDLSGQIAFVTARGQLAIVDPAAGEPRLLSAVGPTFQFPAFAPAGDRIAAIGTDATAGTVSVFDAASEAVAYRSETERPIYLYWAPDGKTLSFIAARPETGLGLWLAEDDASARLLATGNPFYWAWNPDASSLLAHVGLTGDGSRLAFARPDTGLPAENLDPPGWFQAPGISPSGRYVAYGIAGPGGARRVVVASHPNVAGEIVRREFAHDGFAMLGWHPTRDLLAVMAPPQPSPHWFGPIQILDAEDGLLDVVVNDVALAFFWSPDGRKLAYVTPVPSDGVQQVAGGPGHAASVRSLLQRVAAARADSPRLASTQAGSARADSPTVVSVRAGSVGADAADAAPAASASTPMAARPTLVQQAPVELRLRVAYLDGAEVDRVTTIATVVPSPLWVNQFLPFFDQYALSHRIWSPASDAIVLPMLGPDGTSRVVVVGLDGTQREVAAGDMPFWNVR